MVSTLALHPHHDGSAVYLSGAVVLGSVLDARVRIPKGFGEVARVLSRSNPDREPRFEAAERLAVTPAASWWQAPVVIENPVHGYRFLIMMADGRVFWLNAAGLSDVEPPDSQDFRVAVASDAPAWAAESVIYQIFPDRFARSVAADSRAVPDWAISAVWDAPVDNTRPGVSQQFFGGDLDGVREHLDHFERLGVTMLYLTPVFPGRSNHRYDAATFTMVDPLLGGDEALVRLVEEVHARGLRIIGDLTSNHSGDSHEWFRSAYGNPGAAESDFYHWRNQEHTQYVSWLGVSSLPKFNWNSTELRRRFIQGPDSVVARWLRAPFRLDGWRIDVANMTGRLAELDLNADVRRTIRRSMVEANPDTILLAESTNDGAADFQGDAWHGAMSYAAFTRPLWSWLAEPGSAAEGGIGMPLGRVPEYTGAQFHAQHRAMAAAYPWSVQLANLNAIDTHDTPRFAGVARPGTVPVAFGLAVTMPGIPVVFAGDEFGLTGRDGEESRTPLPWSRIDEHAETIGLYAALIGLKRAHPALNGGGIRWLHVDEEALVFVRESVDESVLVLAARSDFAVVLPAGAVDTVDAVGAVGAVDAELLFGDAELTTAASGLLLTGSGPGFAAWALPAPVTSSR